MTKTMNTISDITLQSERGIFPPPLEPIRPATPTHSQRRVDWTGRVLNATWMALMLSCAGECVFRLLWAVTP